MTATRPRKLGSTAPPVQEKHVTTSTHDSGGHDSSGHDSDADLIAILIAQADDRGLADLHDRLTDQAQQAGLLDIAYRTVDSPVGELLVASTDQGLVRVAYAVEGHDVVLSKLADRISPRILRAPARLDDVARQLDEYFSGRRRAFDLPLDMQLAHGFRRLVLDHLREIGYGATASYASVATASGHPHAVRAVGTACARNPLPVVVPCHRVVRSDGNLGGYAGGTEAKRTLLTLEAA
jgi:methylated-DNA-[protein]-cysteine S-methyltransferase